MIGRQDQQQLVAALFDQLHRGDADGRRRVAAEGLEQKALDAQFARRQLLLDDEAMVLVAHQQRLLHAVESQALDGLLKQCLFTGQGQELLGERLAGKGPQSGTAAT